MYNMFEEDEKSIVFSSMVLPLSEGFVDRELKIACYTEHQIFNKYNPFFLLAGFQKTKQAILNKVKSKRITTTIYAGRSRLFHK